MKAGQERDLGRNTPILLKASLCFQYFGNPFFSGTEIVKITKVSLEQQSLDIIGISMKGPFVAHNRYANKIADAGHLGIHHRIDTIWEDAKRYETERAIAEPCLAKVQYGLAMFPVQQDSLFYDTYNKIVA